jgi:transposase
VPFYPAADDDVHPGLAAGVACRSCPGGMSRYLTHNGPVWRALPADFPPPGTVYWWAAKWEAARQYRADAR